MAQEKVLVTQEGLNDLLKEQEHLIHVVRDEVIEDLRAARAQGDLSENADYDAARDRQAHVEARIRELEIMLNNVQLISEKKGGQKVVKLGTTVSIISSDSQEENEFTIVGSVEADPINRKLSNLTPLAIALLDQRVGAQVTVQVDEPYMVKIVNIK